MEHGAPQIKSQHDRIRQQRGSVRKEQLRAIRRIVQAWRRGRAADLSMQAVAAALDKETD